MFSLNLQDAIKGIVVAVIGAVLTAIQTMLSNGGVIDWKQVGMIALTTLIAYLVKNYFSDSTKVLGITIKK